MFLNAKNCYKLWCVEKKITKLDWRSTIYNVIKFFFILLCLMFSVFNTLCSHNLHWILASSIYSMGTIRKILICNFHFWMLGSTAVVLVFFVWCFNRKRNVCVAEETSDLHIRELLKYHEYFPILVFEGSLSIEIAYIDYKGYHYVINLGIFNNFFISV